MRRKGGRSRNGLVLAAVLVAATVFCVPVRGSQSYEEEGFGLRLAPAFIQFIDVSAMGGETVANRYSSAVNPASADWESLGEGKTAVLAPYFSQVRFDTGTHINVYGESVTLDIGEWGTIQPTLSQVRSNTETDRQGVGFDYEVDSAQVQWARRFEDWAVGANLNYADAQVVRTLGPLALADSDARNWRLRLGVLHQPADPWLLGMIVEYGHGDYRAEGVMPTPLGPVPYVMRDRLHQFIFRPGASYEYADRSTVYADCQYGRFWDDTGRLRTHRLTVGVDHRLCRWIWVRGSTNCDWRGNTGVSAGLSMFMSRSCGLDVGYRHNVLPELNPEFGRSNILQATFNLRF